MNLIVFPGGEAEWRGRRLRCALGRAGVIAASDKREGDGATPAGIWAFRRTLYRPDRLKAPDTVLAQTPITPEDGWCDDPSDPLYNRPVTLPFAASRETLWRDDALYDLIVVLGHNDAPPVAGRGSAIFLHVAAPGYAPTEGCVALSRDDLLTVVTGCSADAAIDIRLGQRGTAE